MSSLPLGSQTLEELQLLLRQCIGQTKRDEVGRSRLSPMRQMPVIDLNRLLWIQPTKPGRRSRIDHAYSPLRRMGTLPVRCPNQTVTNRTGWEPIL